MEPTVSSQLDDKLLVSRCSCGLYDKLINAEDTLFDNVARIVNSGLFYPLNITN
jgi:hypothetical protein